MKFQFHSIKKMLAAGLLAVAAVTVVAGCGGGSGSQGGGGKQFLNIGTGGTAGTYYPIGGAMAEILNENIEGMNASAQSTGASVANINMLKDGEVDLAIVQNDITYYAVNGSRTIRSTTSRESPHSIRRPASSLRWIAAASRKSVTSRASASPSVRQAPALRQTHVRFSRPMASPMMTFRCSTSPSAKAPAR